MDKFICKENASLFYLRTNDGAGGFLNPENDAEHNYSVVEKRGGHEMGFYSLRGLLSEKWIPEQVKHTARMTLNSHKGKLTDSWIHSVYNYFRHCYSKDGIDRNASNCIVDHTDSLPAENHLAYLFIKSFFPEVLPDNELIHNNGNLGSWSKQ